MPGHEFAFTHGAKTLLVEIIGYAIPANFIHRLLGVLSILLAQIMNRNAKSVGANVFGSERLGGLAQVLDVQSGLVQLPFGAVKDGEVLNRLGVTVFQSAEPNALPIDFPAPADEV